MYSCEGCHAKFNRQGNLTQHLEKSTNLLCVDARQAVRDKKRPIQGRLPEVDIEDSEDSAGDSDLEEDEGGFVDLNPIPVPVEVGAEEQIIEAEMDVDEDDVDEDDARRTGMAPGGISIESHNHLEAPPVYVTKFGGQAGKPVCTNVNDGYSNYVEQLETGGQENIWVPFASKMEWEVAQWAKLHGPGSTAFSELLAIEGVSQVQFKFSS